MFRPADRISIRTNVMPAQGKAHDLGNISPELYFRTKRSSIVSFVDTCGDENDNIILFSLPSFRNSLFIHMHVYHSVCS